MNTDDIIRMAREAGIPLEIDWAGRPSTLVIKDGGTYFRGVDDLERFAKLIALAEREACAKVCEEIAKLYSTDIFPEDGTSIDCSSAKMGRVVTKNCAQSIRARGQ